MTSIVTYKQTQEKEAYTLGGKANNLFLLQALHFNVPPFVVIPWEQLEHISNQSGNFEIPEPIIQEILETLNESSYFAVRSSGAAEDSHKQSFAGQYETFLYVTQEQLAEKIKEVWLSAYSNRVQEYSKSSEETTKIAIIIQEMLDADAAGVAFGINPVNGNRKQYIINAVYGLGEGLVSGQLNSDSFIVEDNHIQTKLVEKPYQIIQNSGGGTKTSDVPEELQKEPVLSDDQVLKISDALYQLYKHTGSYQDIEFAWYQNQLYLLQTRPITNIRNLADQSGQYLVWDNSNIIESYPGLTCPLTFSFIIRMYERVYVQLLQLFGVSNKDIHSNAHVFQNMLGIIKGRVYYNLYSWYKVLSLLPGYSINASFMEKMMGVKEKFELHDVKKRSRLADYLRILFMIINLLRNLLSLKKQTRQFHNHFNSVMAQYSAIDFDGKSTSEHMSLYRHYEDRLLQKWKAPMVNDFFAMIFFGTVHKMADKYGLNDKKEIHNDLFSGAKDIISHEPVKIIEQIVNKINANEAYKSLFQHNHEFDVWLKLQNEEYSGLKKAFDEYFNAFGDRYVGELKLETKTYKQRPELFVKLIQSYVTQNTPFMPSAMNHSIRSDAEKHVQKTLRWKPFKKLLFYMMLKKARHLVSNRENLRYNRTLAFGIVRDIFNALGKRFYAEGIINHADDIFYLSTHEIFDFIEGKSLNTNLQDLIEMRKTKYEAYQKQAPPPERIKTYGMVYHGNKFESAAAEINKDGNIRGLGCCAGVVKAKVRIIHDPTETGSLNGDILVTSSTDPGWVTLFPSASGILVERGSLLSHSAIVSREMGIPCIVGITNVMQQLKNGDLVEMDGSSGVVKIIESNEKQ